jgi:DNA-directed RNA polymerase sigma subunit (sigma70/sigma32)
MAVKLTSRQGLKDYLLLLGSLGELDEARRGILLKRSALGDAQAGRELVEAYLPRVLKWVAPRRGEALSFQELIAIGNCALIETVKSYRGDATKFDERACLAVHQALDTALKMGA